MNFPSILKEYHDEIISIWRRYTWARWHVPALKTRANICLFDKANFQRRLAAILEQMCAVHDDEWSRNCRNRQFVCTSRYYIRSTSVMCIKCRYLRGYLRTTGCYRVMIGLPAKTPTISCLISVVNPAAVATKQVKPHRADASCPHTSRHAFWPRRNLERRCHVNCLPRSGTNKMVQPILLSSLHETA